MIVRKSRITILHGKAGITYQNEYVVRDMPLSMARTVYYKHRIYNKCKFNFGTHDIYTSLVRDSSF